MQQILGSRRGRKQKTLPLLALSLRDLGYGIAPPEVLIKRSQDNLEVFWPYAQILNGDLASWVGVGNDAIVTGIYNQSTGFLCTPFNDGFTSDNTNSTGGRIVTNGVLETENGKPIIRRYRNYDGYKTDISGNRPTAHYFGVIKQPVNNTAQTVVLGHTSDIYSFMFAGKTDDQGTGINRSSTSSEERVNGVATTFSTKDEVKSKLANQSIFSFKANMNFKTSYGSTIATSYRSHNNTNGLAGMVDTQEVLLYGEHQDTLKIEQELNDYYNAFN